LLSKSGDDFRIIRPEDIDVWSSTNDGASQPADNNKDMNVELNEVVYKLHRRLLCHVLVCWREERHTHKLSGADEDRMGRNNLSGKHPGASSVACRGE